jgi:hypothetical protein
MQGLPGGFRPDATFVSVRRVCVTILSIPCARHAGDLDCDGVSRCVATPGQVGYDVWFVAFTMTRKRLRKATRIPKSQRMDITRSQLDRCIEILNRRTDIINEILRQVEANTRAIDVQFTRMAQMQADIDLIRRAWTKRKPGTRKSPIDD